MTKEDFTVEENLENIKIARRNYLISVVTNKFSDLLPSLKTIELTEEVVNKILYKTGKYYYLHYPCASELPPWQ